MTTRQAEEPSQVDALPVSVILERRPAASRWIDHVWSATGITIGRQPATAEARPVRTEGDTAFFLVGGLDVTLFRDECESYYYNLVSDSPRAYVLAHVEGDGQPPQPFRVSMSFDEAHAYLEGEDEVYAVDVPPELYRWAEAFVIANYFPEKKTKRKLRDWRRSEDEPGRPA
jgi:hypothetical protein